MRKHQGCLSKAAVPSIGEEQKWATQIVFFFLFGAKQSILIIVSYKGNERVLGVILKNGGQSESWPYGPQAVLSSRSTDGDVLSYTSTKLSIAVGTCESDQET